MPRNSFQEIKAYYRDDSDVRKMQDNQAGNSMLHNPHGSIVSPTKDLGQLAHFRGFETPSELSDLYQDFEIYHED